jgi:hypothetical protein
MRAGSGASMITSCQTVPVNQSAGVRREGADPLRRISISFVSLVRRSGRLFAERGPFAIT